MPFGGHKGSAIMLACELFGGVLTGAWGEGIGAEGGPYRRRGVLMLAVRADVFDGLEVVSDRAEQLVGEIRSSTPLEGFDEVSVPGDPELEARRRYVESGIPVPDSVLAQLRRLAG
jgi:LDH2 family malate/lactate/ureidoglycolate dehydrogenase